MHFEDPGSGQTKIQKAQAVDIEVEAALNRISELAVAEGGRLEMTLYGGAVMLLAYGARDVTSRHRPA